jgi:regulator of protease activity HflC (stomatin/prohibitin superfamily)
MNLLVDFATCAALVTSSGIVLFGMPLSTFSVGQKHEGLLERFGKYRKTVQPGLGFKIPLVDKVRRISLMTRQFPIDVDVVTKDNASVHLPVTVQYHVVDSKKWAYEAQNPENILKARILNIVRNEANTRDLVELFIIKGELQKKITDETEDFTAKYGAVIEKVVVDQPNLPTELKSAFNRVIASLRLKEAAVNEGDASKIKTVKEAEGRSEAMITIGRGMAGQREEIAKGAEASLSLLKNAGLEPEMAAAFFVITNAQATLEQVSKGAGSLILGTVSGNDNMSEMTKLAAALRGANRPVQGATGGQHAELHA